MIPHVDLFENVKPSALQIMYRRQKLNNSPNQGRWLCPGSPVSSMFDHMTSKSAPSRMHMSRRLGNPTICIGENKGADQLRSNCEADQHLCFHYTDSTIPLLSKSKFSNL